MLLHQKLQLLLVMVVMEEMAVAVAVVLRAAVLVEVIFQNPQVIIINSKL